MFSYTGGVITVLPVKTFTRGSFYKDIIETFFYTRSRFGGLLLTKITVLHQYNLCLTLVQRLYNLFNPLSTKSISTHFLSLSMPMMPFGIT